MEKNKELRTKELRTKELRTKELIIKEFGTKELGIKEFGTEHCNYTGRNRRLQCFSFVCRAAFKVWSYVQSVKLYVRYRVTLKV